MSEFQDFFINNIWLCLIVGAVVIIVGDEVLGVTRGIFGDDLDDEPPPAKVPLKDELGAYDVDPQPRRGGEKETKIVDFLEPPRG